MDMHMTDETKEVQETETKTIVGRINFISEEGWGFIISKEIPFERIFWHWTSLRGDTLNFKEVEEGMNVEFIPIQIEKDGKKQWRAIKIKVVQ